MRHTMNKIVRGLAPIAVTTAAILLVMVLVANAETLFTPF